MAHAMAQFFGPRPLGPWGGAKGQISFNFNYRSQFQILLNKTLCVFSQMKKYKTYQTGFSFSRLGHATGVGLWGYRGVGDTKKIRNSTKFGVRVTHMNGTSNGTIILVSAPLGRGEGLKGQISFNFNK